MMAATLTDLEALPMKALAPPLHFPTSTMGVLLEILGLCSLSHSMVACSALDCLPVTCIEGTSGC